MPPRNSSATAYPRAMPDRRQDERRQNEHCALVALLRSLPKGVGWGKIADQVLERGSAVAVWEDSDGDTLLPRPEQAQALALADAARDIERWHSEGGIALVGPRYFGYDVDPVRVVEEAR